MADDARTRYLAELFGVLPLPADRRAEVVAEIATHLDDAVAERVDRGGDPGEAEADAQARLGSPTDLARSLARPEQSAWRSLAGFGAALWSGTGHGIYGYLFATLFLVAVAIGLAALVQAVGLLLRTGWTLQTDDMGWNSLLIAIAIGAGCYFAGRVLPDRFGRSSRHLAADARPWIVAICVPLLAALTVLVVETPQNWASVVAYTVAPLGLVLGAYHPNLLPGRARLGLVTGVALLLVAGIVAAVLAGGSTSGAVASELPGETGLASVGPAWHPPGDSEGPAFDSTSWGTVDGAVRWQGDLAAGVRLDGFRDLRLEAWRTVDQWMRLDPAYDAPFATAPVSVDGSTYTADIVTTGVPGVTRWTLLLTGIDGAGTRTVIDASAGGQSMFTGSAWDWIVAVVAGD